MYHASWIGWDAAQAGRAFDRAVRDRRRARCGRGLAVHDPAGLGYGTGLPPIPVARVAGACAVRDGRHRARAALSITASVG